MRALKEMTPDEFASILMETGLLHYANPVKHWYLHETMADLWNGLAKCYYKMGKEDAILEQSTTCGRS